MHQTLDPDGLHQIDDREGEKSPTELTHANSAGNSTTDQIARARAQISTIGYLMGIGWSQQRHCAREASQPMTGTRSRKPRTCLE